MSNSTNTSNKYYNTTCTHAVPEVARFRIPAIPDMCSGILSIYKLPSSIASSMDTTNLTAVYGFTSEDLNNEWAYESTSFGSITESAEGCENVSGDITSSDFTFVTFLSAADSNQGVRAWVVRYNELPCIQGDASVNIHSPVHYATNKPVFLPSPTFNPNRAARSGGAAVQGLPPTLGQVVSVDYDKNEATVRLYGLDSRGNLILTNEEVSAIIL